MINRSNDAHDLSTELNDGPPVCIYPKWRFNSSLIHSLVMCGLCTSLPLIVLPLAILADPTTNAMLDENSKKGVAAALGIGVVDAITTGITFFCGTKKNVGAVAVDEEAPILTSLTQKNKIAQS